MKTARRTAASSVLVTGCAGFMIVNLGSDRPVVLADAISTIEEMVGRKAQVKRRPPHPANVRATCADIGKARNLLGWRPEIGFREGLSHLVDWYRDNRSWASPLVTE